MWGTTGRWGLDVWGTKPLSPPLSYYYTVCVCTNSVRKGSKKERLDSNRDDKKRLEEKRGGALINAWAMTVQRGIYFLINNMVLSRSVVMWENSVRGIFRKNMKEFRRCDCLALLGVCVCTWESRKKKGEGHEKVGGSTHTFSRTNIYFFKKN